MTKKGNWIPFGIEISLKEDLFSDPESEKARCQNLLFNLLGGLDPQSLTKEETTLLKKFGSKKE